LLEDANIIGKATGRITGLTSNTITVSGAGWTPGELSNVATPHLLEITSGNAKGRMLLISTSSPNTADTLTIAAEEALRVGALTGLGITTEENNPTTYRIRPVDTLKSIFGTPEIGGGTSAANADTITLLVNGSPTTYFYSTTLGHWTRVGLGAADSSHVPIPPYAGLQYARLAAQSLEFIVTGKVPSGQREASIKNSGTTLLSPLWPVNQTLGSLGLQNTPNWLSGSSPSTADTVVLIGNGSPSTFYYDGSNWRRTGLGGSVANSTVIPVGASIMVNRKGGDGFSFFKHPAPYNLQ
jgi:hypothetical protein